jgi:hypothetical protein
LYCRKKASSPPPLDLELREFRQRLGRLTAEICDTLEAMSEAAPPPPEESFKVFIADTASSLRKVRDRVQSELQEKGVRILERVPEPWTYAEHERVAKDRIEDADLCVHLLDGVPGREIQDRPEKSYLERQAELGLEFARSQFIWVPSDLRIEEIEDDAHKTLLQRLEGVTAVGDEPPEEDGDEAAATADEAEGEGGVAAVVGRPAGDSYKFVRDLPSAVARDILERIEQLKKERAAAPAAPGEVRRALLDTHIQDQRHVLALSSFLADRQIVPLINFEEDTPRKSIESFENQLRLANLLIVVYGGVPPESVRERLREALKFAVTQNCPLRACGVYIAPPRKRDEEKRFDVPLLNVDVLDNTERFDPATLSSLLARI